MAFQRAKALALAQGLSLLSSCWGAGERPSSALGPHTRGLCTAVLPGALSFTFFLHVAGCEALYPDLHTLSQSSPRPTQHPPATPLHRAQGELGCRCGLGAPHPPCSAPAGVPHPQALSFQACQDSS